MSSPRFDRGNSSDNRSSSSLPDQRESVPPVGREPDILLSQTPPVPPSTRQPHYPSLAVNPESFVPQTPTRPDQEDWASMAASAQPGATSSAFQTPSGILAGNVGSYFETSSQNLQIPPGLISGSFGHHEMTPSSPNYGQGNPGNAVYSGVMRAYEPGTSAPVANSQYPYGVGPSTSRQPGETDPPAQTVRLHEQQTYSPQHHPLPSPHPQIHISPTGFAQQPSPGLHPPSGQAGYLQQSYELRPELRNYQMPTSTTIQPAQHPAYLSPFPETYVPQQISSQYHLPPGYPTIQEQPHALSPLQPLVGTVPSRHSPSPVPMDQVRVVNSRPKPQCWEHGCNGREFSTFSNLLRHQREKAGLSAKPECPYCGTVFTRTTARNGHLSQGKCKARRQPTPK